jgi:hypothetical protein
LEVLGHNYVTGIDEKGGIFARRGAKSWGKNNKRDLAYFFLSRLLVESTVPGSVEPLDNH